MALAFPTELFFRFFLPEDDNRSSQFDPAKPARQRQIPGPMHLPPCRHFGLQTAVRKHSHQIYAASPKEITTKYLSDISILDTHLDKYIFLEQSNFPHSNKDVHKLLRKTNVTFFLWKYWKFVTYHVPVSQRLPVQPFLQLQTFRRLQCPPLRQLGSQGGAVHWHWRPANPSGHWQRLRLKQVPPLRQGIVQPTEKQLWAWKRQNAFQINHHLLEMRYCLACLAWPALATIRFRLRICPSQHNGYLYSLGSSYRHSLLFHWDTILHGMDLDCRSQCEYRNLVL